MSTTTEVCQSDAATDLDHGLTIASHGEKLGSTLDSTRKSSIDVNKLEEILKVFQSQLDLQQRQLDLLRCLAQDKITPAADLTDTCNDNQKSILWMNERRPSSDFLKQIGDNFIKLCESARVLWFSTHYGISCGANGTKGVAGSPNLNKESAVLSKQLLQDWPESLGSESEMYFQWEASLGIRRWYFCHTEGSTSRAQVFLRHDKLNERCSH